jgi:hypothetical protein
VIRLAAPTDRTFEESSRSPGPFRLNGRRRPEGGGISRVDYISGRAGFSSGVLSRRRRQRESHAHLAQDVARWHALSVWPRRKRLDAVIVPASRPASFLQPIIELAACLDVFLVVLCSTHTEPAHVVELVARTPRARALIISISGAWTHAGFPTRTCHSTFRVASAWRSSDLSLKRNVGLLLARLHGWNKVVFVDDDITFPQTDSLARLAAQLDRHQIAGMVVERYPDNSVVCHARRLAGLSQDVFITGAGLGVHCNNLPLSFFPDIYNEDWFFFAKEAAARDLPRVGRARQMEYDPFANPDRARREEFGDLMAEGLYALIGEEDVSSPFHEQLREATPAYWARFIHVRYDVIAEIRSKLGGIVGNDVKNGRVTSALASLAAAQRQLDTITADLCVNFLNAWWEDLQDWQRFSNAVSNVGNTREAMDFLGLKTWSLVEFGAAVVDSQTAAEAVRR